VCVFFYKKASVELGRGYVGGNGRKREDGLEISRQRISIIDNLSWIGYIRMVKPAESSGPDPTAPREGGREREKDCRELV
jgi:hypothetical protein